MVYFRKQEHTGYFEYFDLGCMVTLPFLPSPRMDWGVHISLGDPPAAAGWAVDQSVQGGGRRREKDEDSSVTGGRNWWEE